MNPMGTVLLIQPWVEDFYTTDCRTQPIGLAYLAGSIKKRFPALNIIIYDCLEGGSRKTIPWPKEFAYLKPYYGNPDSGPFSLFHNYYRFGKEITTIQTELKELSPMLIGISSMFTPYYRESIKVADICRDLFPDVPIVMGGNHATMHPFTLLQPSTETGLPAADFVLRGEAEETICQLIDALIHSPETVEHIPNIVTPASKELVPVTIPERDTIPHPDFSSLNQSAYRYKQKQMSFIVSSRSCPYRCSFCSIHSVFGTKYYTRPVDDIIDEITYRYSQGVRHFDFEDDNLSAQPAFLHTLLDRLLELQLDITCSVMNGICYHTLSEELIGKMKRVGFEELNLSLVTLNPDLRSDLRRPQGGVSLETVLENAAKHKIHCVVYYIIGLPEQSLEEVIDTLLFLTSLQCLVGASPFYFTPGSPIYNALKGSEDHKTASKNKDPLVSARLTAMDFESKAINRETLFTLFKLTRVFNYLKECVDNQTLENAPYWKDAITAIQQGEWHTYSKAGRQQLPFSHEVRHYIAQKAITIKGYKTENLYTIPSNR